MFKKIASVLVIAFVLFWVCSSAQAQSAFEQGRVIGTAGLVLERDATPVAVAVEYGVADDFGIGGKVVYQSSEGYSAYSIGAFGQFHLARAFSVTGRKLDPYAGLHVGKPFASSHGRSGSGRVFVAGQLGARYLINEKIGPYAQLNLGFVNASGSSFELGVAYKFGN